MVNAGSSSLKLRIVDPDGTVVASADRPRRGGTPVTQDLSAFVDASPPFDAAGHRIVHGGPDHVGPLLLDRRAEDDLDRLGDLAPLHNPPAIEAVRALRALRPGPAQVACFDTAFHAGMPAEAATYAIPAEWTARWHLRRYGFHGLSHASAGRRAAALLGRPSDDLRLVTAHLGSGASLAAVAGGRSVDTTMGFTPLAGLVMATRAGDVDPGLVLWLVRHAGLTPEEVDEALEGRSGLLGLSGVSGDLRLVLAAADGGDQPAALAYAVYVHRLRAGVAAMAAAMGGVDGVVFTGGAGEGSARLRGDTCAGLGFLGVTVDEGANQRAVGDRLISPASSPVAVLVVEAREDLEIARQVRATLDAMAPGPPAGGADPPAGGADPPAGVGST